MVDEDPRLTRKLFGSYSTPGASRPLTSRSSMLLRVVPSAR